LDFFVPNDNEKQTKYLEQIVNDIHGKIEKRLTGDAYFHDPELCS
jgi:hypothetical protein